MALGQAKTEAYEESNEDIASLVDLAISRDQDAWQELYSRSWPDVFAIAYSRLHNRADADDAVLMTYEKAHRSLEGIKDRSKFLPWIRKIAYNMAINFATREVNTRGASLDTNMPVQDNSADSPLQVLIDEEDRHEMMRLFEMLPNEMDKRVLTLRYKYDLSMKEMQEALSHDRLVPIGTVKRRLFSARNHLREILEKYSLLQIINDEY